VHFVDDKYDPLLLKCSEPNCDGRLSMVQTKLWAVNEIKGHSHEIGFAGDLLVPPAGKDTEGKPIKERVSDLLKLLDRTKDIPQLVLTYSAIERAIRILEYKNLL
jgi:hypothetical protein